VGDVLRNGEEQRQREEGGDAALAAEEQDEAGESEERGDECVHLVGDGAADGCRCRSRSDRSGAG